jgi:hypothetical protein
MPINNPIFKDKSIINGGKEGILAASDIFFGNNIICI